MKVIIAGSRGITDYEVVKAACVESQFEFTEVVSGKARGVDSLGEDYAAEIGVSVAEFPADWEDISVPGALVKYNSYGAYNAKAGMQRNWKMAKHADALVAIWDGKSKGTKAMINFAKKEGLKVFVKVIQ